MAITERERGRHPEGLTTAQERLAIDFFNIGVGRFGDFKLQTHQNHPEAPLSPIYFNFRVLPLWPEVLNRVADVYVQLAEKAQPYDACMGIPDTGVPLATAFSLKTETPQIIMRKEKKAGYGIEGQFLTPLPDNVKTVLVIDDLMTTAKSKETGIDKLEEAGLIVSDVIVLLDRDQNGKGKARLAERGVSFHAAFTMNQLLDFYARVGKITYAELTDIRNRLAKLTEYLEKTTQTPKKTTSLSQK